MGQQNYVWQQQITVPANRPTSNPLITEVNLGDVWIDSVEIDIPPGNKGLAGIFLAMETSHVNNPTTWLPFGAPATWILADSELLKYKVGVEMPGAWGIWQYNTDVVSHLMQIRIEGYFMVQAPANSSVQPVAQLVL
jgi:hypothetical protein